MRTELDVPFSHKEEAKALGAKWDRTKKIWYVPSGVNPEPFAEWLPGVDRSDPSAPYIYLVLGKRECWKCHKETSVAAFGIPYRIDDDKGIAIAHAPNEAGHITIDTANANALAIVPALGCVPGEIRDYLSKRCGYKPVGARASKAPSLGNTCTSCDALQGSRYLFEEPSSPFALTAINKLPALEFVRVEVAGVFGVPATRTDFDQALFTWHATITPSSTSSSVRGFIYRDRDAFTASSSASPIPRRRRRTRYRGHKQGISPDTPAYERLSVFSLRR